jgi:hypothetical protein
MTKEMIIAAYCRIRTIDNTIPDDVLDFMKEAAIEKIVKMNSNVSEEKLRGDENSIPISKVIETIVPIGAYFKTLNSDKVYQLHSKIDDYIYSIIEAEKPSTKVSFDVLYINNSFDKGKWIPYSFLTDDGEILYTETLVFHIDEKNTRNLTTLSFNTKTKRFQLSMYGTPEYQGKIFFHKKNAMIHQDYMKIQQVKIEATNFNNTLPRHPMSSIGLIDVLVDFYEHMQSVTTSLWEKKLLELTPSGSEFVDDPQRCFDYVKDFQQNQHEFILQLIKEKKELQEQLLKEINKTNSSYNQSKLLRR